MLAHTLWQFANSFAAARYIRALKKPGETQARILAGYLQRNAGTVYGKLHGFGQVRSPAEYQQRVSITTYDDYVPYIERIAAGEERILTAERVVYFAPTSGSAGAEKYIPYTRSLLREFNAAIAAWINNLFAHMPSLKGGPAYWSITPALARAPRMASKIPVGFDDDAAYLGPFGRWLAASTLAVPSEVARLRDIDEFHYQTLLHLLKARNLRLISVWHPSFLTLLLEAIPRHWERIIEDIGRSDAERAAALKVIGAADPPRYWPQLAMISCWTHGHAELAAHQLQAVFPETFLQPKGLISTEAFASLPWQGAPATLRLHPLAVTSHFFEFLADDRRAILPQHADLNAEYTLLITTGGGLYRYNTHDRIRVTARLGQTPCIRFMGKQDHISDLRGEKLAALFVGQVIGRLFAGQQPAFAMLAPELSGTGDARYTLFVDTPAALPSAKSLDEALCANPHYAYCRRLAQLGPAAIVRVRNAGALYLEACRQSGQRLGTIKPTPLHAALHWPEVFRPQAVE